MVTHRHHPSSRPFPAAPSTRRHASSQPYSARSVCCPLHFQDTIFPLASLSKSINPSWNPRARLPRAAAATWNLPKAPSLLSPPQLSPIAYLLRGPPPPLDPPRAQQPHRVPPSSRRARGELRLENSRRLGAAPPTGSARRRRATYRAGRLA